MIKIEQKITGVSVKSKEDSDSAPSEQQPVVFIHERLERPETLEGRTYKIKTPLSEHAMYVTINDVLVEDEVQPFEIFINSKNMEHYQWITALTRVISAVFRKGGESKFLIEELRSVFDPKGGYFKKGGRFMPSLVAEIGDVLEQHLDSLGHLDDALDEHQEAHIESARAKAGSDPAVMNNAQMCTKCNNKTVVMLDGCATCLTCCDSKCG